MARQVRCYKVKKAVILVILMTISCAHGQGLIGPKGEKGSPGPPGERGRDGDPGDPGEAGAPGPVGDQGLKGDLGSPGEPGPPGKFGPRGEAGFTGVPGQKGAKGEPGGFSIAPQQYGLFGVGPPGLPGPVGPAGPPGQPGHTGLAGESGNPGPPGARGPVGEPGLTGDPGESGLPGQSGKTGLPGIPGTPGSSVVGVMYTHWASMNCPFQAENHTLIVSGNLLLSAEPEGTQFSQPLCQTIEVNNTLQRRIERMRSMRTRLSDISCALCLIPGHSVVFTQYGNSICPTGWSLAYNGLMVILNDANAMRPICATISVSDRLSQSVSVLIDEQGNDLACAVCSM